MSDKAMFYWPMAEVLDRVGNGHIIVFAHDADHARAVAREQFEMALRDEDNAMGIYWGHDGDFLTEMDEERFHDLLRRLAVDLEKEPYSDKEAIFILGSE